MRLAKYLSHAGIASRRQAEELIKQGRIKLNGCVVQKVATEVEPGLDRIEFDGQLVEAEEPVYILLHKPAGFISSVFDPQGRPTVLDLVADIQQRIYPVGRLDYDTEGLLLLTNDGQFTNLVIHPRYQIEKTYQARVKGVPTEKDLRRLREGVELDDGITSPAEVQMLEQDKRTSLLAITIHEGRKRQVKRMCMAVGHPVVHLKRIGLESLTLEGLTSGEYRFRSKGDVDRLWAIARSTSKLPQASWDKL